MDKQRMLFCEQSKKLEILYLRITGDGSDVDIQRHRRFYIGAEPAHSTLQFC